MKKTIFALACAAAALFATSCVTDDPSSCAECENQEVIEFRDGFVRGADISWYTEMEADGKKFYNSQAQERTCPMLMTEIGMQAARFRVWVDPQNKFCDFCDTKDVVAKAVAAKEAGLDVMIDFHYSDWWADPGRQDTPKDWEGLGQGELQSALAAHTTSVLQSLKNAGVSPKWIQIGNETNSGMVFPAGQLWNGDGDIPGGWRNFTNLYNAGYDAAKTVFPSAKIMPHLANAYQDNAWWFERLKQNGGKFDMIALSHYPMGTSGKTWQEMNAAAIANIKALKAEFGVDVMVSEIGVPAADPTTGNSAITDFLEKANAETACAGVFYWEPEVYGNWKPSSYDKFSPAWNAYPNGAFTVTGRPSAILNAFR